MDHSIHLHSLALASSVIPAWNSVTLENSSLTLLTGNSNKVYRLKTSLPILPQKLIYRVFGQSKLIDNSRERKIFSELSLKSFGPLQYLETENERLEEYLAGYKPITNHLFHDSLMISKLSKKLKKLHSLELSSIRDEENILEANILKWREMVKEKLFLFESSGRLAEVQEAISEETLQVFFSVLPRTSQVVFCHLDPSPTNFLLNSKKGKIRFVDFEYAGMSYRSFDFALMLVECQKDYFYDKPPYFRFLEHLAPSDQVVKEYVLNYGGGKELWIEIKRSLVVANYLWSVWSLAAYSGPSDGYDYLLNGVVRFNLFKEMLEKFFEAGGVENLQKIADQLFEKND